VNGKFTGVENMGKMRSLCRKDKRELKVLADDFGLSERKDVQKIIATCRNYNEGHREIMGIYDKVYLKGKWKGGRNHENKIKPD